MKEGKTYEKGSFGEKLALSIDDAGFTKNAFFKKLGISKSYLFDLLNNRTFPSASMQIKITEALGIPEDKKADFYDSTAKIQGRLPADIAEALAKDPKMYQEIRRLIQHKTHSNTSTNRG